jgi:transcriptional regulator with XRE-family HTH domain
MKQKTRKEVGMRVQELMRQAKFTLVQWSARAGVPHDSARQWASGHRVPEAESIDALANGLEKYVTEVAPEIVEGLRKAARDRREGA